LNSRNVGGKIEEGGNTKKKRERNRGNAGSEEIQRDC